MDSEKEWPRRAAGESSTAAAPKAENASPRCERLRPVASIKNSKRIGEVLKKGARVHSRHVGLAYLPRIQTGANACLAVITPKRAGNAVKRNSVRRVMREQARLSTGFQSLPLDIVLFWKGDITPDSRKQARSETAKLLSGLKL